MSLFGGSRSSVNRPHIPLFNPPGMDNDVLQSALEAFRPSGHLNHPLAQNSGYVLLTNKQNHDDQIMGRQLEFVIDRGLLGGRPEQVIMDGHVIWEHQVLGILRSRRALREKLKNKFFDEWDIQQLTRVQVQTILADTENDPEMYGQTAREDDMMEAYAADMEQEYLERFEEDYQRRFEQEYPGHFSKDFHKHYNDMVEDELDEVEDDYEELYTEYIVTPKHIRYKR
jgi:hypothetical protein|tara:strand:+ start:1116 stop:1796 length:681 start_codon:yes stop_codon:yes gene_type:complete